MDQVITFDKSLQERLQEYNDVLSSTGTLSVSTLKKEWSFYLEFALDSNSWQAVWKIPRKTCEELEIPFPSVVLVVILNIDFASLKALVKVLAVQDDISIPEQHFVPLMQLWPTKDQDKSLALNIKSTANGLDMLRFFYAHIFMPWDYDDDETTDWRIKHLETRLRLYYDMKNGIIPKSTSEHLHSLITEAKHLQTMRESLEIELCEQDVEVNANGGNKMVESLLEINIRLIEIKNEIEILENPILRSVILKKQHKVSCTRELRNIWLVFEQGKVADYVNFLNQVQILYPDEILKFSPFLSMTLESSNPNDIYILNNSTHYINCTGALEDGGVLKGISSKSETILTSNVDDVMLDFRGKVLIEHLTIDAKTSQYAIVIRKGVVTLNNCKLIGDNKSSTHQGIIVLSGGTLQLIGCDVSNFCTAIVGNSGSNIVIKNSEIHAVNFGLKIFDNCKVTAEKTSIYNCKDYGICVEVEDSMEIADGRNIGDFSTLNIIPDMNVEFLNGENNEKGDVIISQKPKLRPFDDLFTNQELDPTMCKNNSGLTMDTDDNNESEDDSINCTVIKCDRNVSPLTI